MELSQIDGKIRHLRGKKQLLQMNEMLLEK